MSSKQDNFYKYHVKKDTTVSELLNSKISFFSGYKEALFFLTEEYEGSNNLDNIYNRYTNEEQKEYELDYIGGTLELVKSGTILYVNQNKLNPELVTVEGDNLFIDDPTGSLGYWPNYQLDLQNNDGNIKAQEEIDRQLPIAQLKNYNASVWIYSKALNQTIDVSPFVSSLTTNNTMEGGGSFNMTLDAFESLEDLQNLVGEEYLSMYHPSNRDTGRIPYSYYAKNIGHKDIVFIRFEKLLLEEDRTGLPEQDLIVSKKNLPRKNYDMIGLVETVNEMFNASMGDKSITVTGTDFTKLLADDGAYFYPVMFADGADTLLFNAQESDKVFKRTFITGLYESFFTYLERSVKDSIGFVVNQLSNLGIVPDDLFTEYVEKGEQTGEVNDRRTKAIRTVNDGEYVDWAEANGVWQIVDVLTDPVIDNRRQVDSLLVKSEGSLMDFMNSICQKPFVEFYIDTYQDKVAFIARQPPFNQKAILNFINSNTLLTVKLQDVYSYDLQWENEFYTWYQIEPNNSFLGYDKYTSLSYIPIVYFPTIADTFGNHRYTISDSYIDKTALNGSEKDILIDPFRNAVVDDFAYVIETTQYLPFTRKGSITISGDRRFKKGTWFYFEPTNEICYIKGVTQSHTSSRNSIDRTTVLSVDRCMVRDFIDEKTVQTDQGNVKASYFNIINTETIKRQLKRTFSELQNDVETKTTSSTTTTKRSFDVDNKVFNFFLSRQQFKQKEQIQYFNRNIGGVV